MRKSNVDIDDGFQNLPKATQILLVAGCFAAIAGTLWGMKKTSESARNKKLTWEEFLFPY